MAVRARQQKAVDKINGRRREQDAISEQADALLRRLGVPGRPHFDHLRAKGYTRAVVIAFEDAERLAKELGR